MTGETTAATRPDKDGWLRRAKGFRLAGVGISAFFTLYLTSLAAEALESNPHHVPTWLIIGLYAVYGVVFVSVPFLSVRTNARFRVGVFVFLFATATVLVWLGGIGTVFVFIYPINMLAFAAPLRVALTVDVVVLGALAVATLVLEDRDTAMGQLLLFGSLAIVTLLMGRLIHTNRALIKAHDEIAGLATREERNRIARDLHDILGHTLTTITVKAALARRLLESGADHAGERAETEIADVEQLARQTLGEVRATVSGYRETSLAGELAAIRAALAAADIAADLPSAIDEIDEPQRTAFAYALREGVTNVIRHSHADRCTVRIGPSRLEIHDDGRGGHAPAGNGLNGLRERLSAIGALLTAGPAPDGGYTLTVRLEK
ncbi:sensor histidine kinase [Phytomonospora endophytica]|uniref:Two-component system sensor histidine kinase DesK n=1 Tax=Phytomonospora endophytica TaxID=714109 RepID=A0A841FT16_9ACTN|nr:sensor histidine kinase [Phytomonospora endophytica]MBB6035669.1 two-component system sensor histidine kinase DesK [Phytomonospora endophytica]GIG69654.1 two-component sensor histidine kinase [Phytomonospora endophytica]